MEAQSETVNAASAARMLANNAANRAEKAADLLATARAAKSTAAANVKASAEARAEIEAETLAREQRATVAGAMSAFDKQLTAAIAEADTAKTAADAAKVEADAAEVEAVAAEDQFAKCDFFVARELWSILKNDRGMLQDELVPALVEALVETAKECRLAVQDFTEHGPRENELSCLVLLMAETDHYLTALRTSGQYTQIFWNGGIWKDAPLSMRNAVRDKMVSYNSRYGDWINSSDGHRARRAS